MAARIERLTPEQASRLPEWRNKWTRIGLSTEKADREKFERNVRRCYDAAGLPAPARIVWVDSPHVLALAAPAAAAALSSVSHLLLKLLRDPLVMDGDLMSTLQNTRRTGSAVHPKVEEEVKAAIRTPVDEVVGFMGRALEDDTWRSVQAVREGSEVVSDAVVDAVEQAIGPRRFGPRRTSLRQTATEVTRRPFESALMGGQFAATEQSWIDFLYEVCGIQIETKTDAAFSSYAAMCESAGWWWPHREFVMVCERPLWIDHEEAEVIQAWGGWRQRKQRVVRLHSAKRRAVQWPDGWGICRFHGVAVPEDVIFHPERIDVARIDAERNVEVRRPLLEIFGQSNYIEQSGARVVHEDETGQLFRRDFQGVDSRGFPSAETLAMVRVVNSTPEPDGTRRIYWLRVPPNTRTARAGVAWTFGVRAEDYRPSVQT